MTVSFEPLTSFRLVPGPQRFDRSNPWNDCMRRTGGSEPARPKTDLHPKFLTGPKDIIVHNSITGNL